MSGVYRNMIRGVHARKTDPVALFPAWTLVAGKDRKFKNVVSPFLDKSNGVSQWYTRHLYRAQMDDYKIN